MERLNRFVDAQANTFAAAITELRAGAKRGHWMWWIFPQIAGLGRSDTARHYAIVSRVEAEEYLAHPLLGPRLVEATRVILSAQGDARTIMGPIDAIKLRSSMTLFAAVADDPADFQKVIDRFFDGVADPETLARI